MKVNEGDIVVSSAEELKNAVNNAPEGTTVFISAGEYVMDSSLDVTKSLQIIGAGAKETVLNFNNHQGIMVRADLNSLYVGGVKLVGNGDGTEAGANTSIGTFNQPYSVGKLIVNDCVIEGFDYGVYFGFDQGITKKATASVDIIGTTVQNCLIKAMYFEYLTGSTIANCKILNNGNDPDAVASNFTDWVCGIDINLKNGEYKDISVTGCEFTGNGANNGGALMIKARGTGNDGSYVNNPATLDGVIISGCTFSGNNKDIVLGEVGKENESPTNVTIDCGTQDADYKLEDNRADSAKNS